MRIGLVGCLAVALLAVLGSVSKAQPPQAVWTKVSLTELHCKGCLKKVAGQLGKVPGVGEVRGDLPSATVFVQHKPGMNPSPKAVWEAIEKADQTPTRLEGPSGTFTQKPPS